MSRSVQTVTGPVDPHDLGVTLVHEHVFVDMYEVTLNSMVFLDDEDTAVAELRALRQLGGATLVDQTVVGLGPQPARLRRVSEAAGVRIVAGTGVYWHRFRPAWVEGLDEAALRDRFIADLVEGFEGAADVRAGMIGEVATGHRGIDDVERRVLRAAALAQRATGVAIATHALFTDIGLEQLDVLEGAGADASRVAIGHADTNPNLAYHLAVLERGAWLGFDTAGQLDKATDDWRTDRLAELADRGHQDRLLVSSDVCKRPALRAFGGSGYGHVMTELVPRLRERGFDERDIRRLLVENPGRFLAGQASSPSSPAAAFSG